MSPLNNSMRSSKLQLKMRLHPNNNLEISRRRARKDSIWGHFCKETQTSKSKKSRDWLCK